MFVEQKCRQKPYTGGVELGGVAAVCVCCVCFGCCVCVCDVVLCTKNNSGTIYIYSCIKNSGFCKRFGYHILI